jgi:hypothetical protein
MTVIQLMELKPGQRISLKDGSTAEVTDNPLDGVWVQARYIESPANPAIIGDEELCHCEDIARLL